MSSIARGILNFRYFNVKAQFVLTLIGVTCSIMMPLRSGHAGAMGIAAPPSDDSPEGLTDEAVTDEAVTSETIEPRKPPVRHRWVKPVAWPGRFIALRGGVLGGQVRVPRFGVGEASADATASFIEAAPLLGIETGYCERHWGAGASFDGSPIGLLSASFLAKGPVRWSVSFLIHYIPNAKLRWVLGITPYTALKIAFPSGQEATMRGFGARVGLHSRLTRLVDEQDQPRRLVWEAFVYGAAERYTDISAGAAGSTQSYSKNDFVAGGAFIGAFSLWGGMQLGFSLY